MKMQSGGCSSTCLPAHGISQSQDAAPAWREKGKRFCLAFGRKTLIMLIQERSMRTSIVALLVPITAICGAFFLFNMAQFEGVHRLVASITGHEVNRAICLALALG
jgi:hypothetical protein